VKSHHVFLIAAAVLLLAAIALGQVARGAGPLPGDLAFSHFTQSALPFNRAYGALWRALAEMLRYLPVVIIAVVLLLRWWDAAALALGACLPVYFLGETLLKPLFARPRPTDDLVNIYQASKGLSFPSGTAMQSMVSVGVTLYLARLASRSGRRGMGARLVAALALLFLLLSNLARVHVGAHWVSDIIGGWLFGAAWVTLLITGREWLLSRRPDLASARFRRK
jgi:undecaprenyl-diphosphatase